MGELIFILLMILFVVVYSKSQKQQAQRKKAGDAAGFVEARGQAQQVRQAAAAGAARPSKNASEAMSAQDQAYFDALRRRAKARLDAKRAGGDDAYATPAMPIVQAAQVAPVVPVAQAAPEYDQGASALDDEGCVGGSLPHDHAEGESHREHARHAETAKRREAAELLVRAQAANAAAERSRRLREAVVMAEVLGKPRALKPRGQVRM